MREEIKKLIEKIKEDAERWVPEARALLAIINEENIENRLDSFNDVRELAYYLLSKINSAYRYDFARYLYTIIYGVSPLAIFVI